MCVHVCTCVYVCVCARVCVCVRGWHTSMPATTGARALRALLWCLPDMLVSGVWCLVSTMQARYVKFHINPQTMQVSTVSTGQHWSALSRHPTHAALQWHPTHAALRRHPTRAALRRHPTRATLQWHLTRAALRRHGHRASALRTCTPVWRSLSYRCSVTTHALLLVVYPPHRTYLSLRSDLRYTARVPCVPQDVPIIISP